MKKLITFGIALVALFINTAAGCGSNTEDPQPDNFQSLLGKWEAQSYAYNITKQDGSMLQDRVDMKARGINIVWEFFSDGRMIATQDGKTVELRWKLNVTKLDKGDIEEGTLILIGTTQKELAQSIGQSGDLTHKIVTVSSAGTATRMSLELDVTKIGPYKHNLFVQAFHKI